MGEVNVTCMLIFGGGLKKEKSNLAVCNWVRIFPWSAELGQNIAMVSWFNFEEYDH